MENDNTQDTQNVEQTPTVVEPKAESTSSMLEKADLLVKKLDEQNKRLEVNIKRAEEIRAREILGGRTEAGQPQKTEAQKFQEEADAESMRIVERFFKVR